MESNTINPYYNLALEEYFIKHKDLNDNILILWQNEPTIVIGKNQNAYEKLNIGYVMQNDIKVVRRLSGGGRFFHHFSMLLYPFFMMNLFYWKSRRKGR